MADVIKHGCRTGRRVVLAMVALVTVVLTAARPATAQSVSRPLRVDLTGSGTGTVVSTPAGFSCSGTAQTCTGSVALTFVTLSATPAAGHTFVGWSGVCTGTGPCTFWPDPGTLVAATFDNPVVTTPYVFYHADALGSVRAITNEQGAVVTRHDYQPFGEDGQPLTGDPIRFGGKELDAETALSYFGARYYRTTQGRFTTVDPVMDVDAALVDPQRFNRYGYALNNPMKFVNPDGKNPVLVALALAWAAAEAASAVYDGYNAIRTWFDPAASDLERSAALGGAVLGAALPGGGYGTVGSTVVRHVDGVADAGRAAYRLGTTGENAVRAVYDIGDKASIVVSGRERIPDGINVALKTLSEVKNVKSQSFTQQLRDYLKAATERGFQFNLYVRKGARLSDPLQQAWDEGLLDVIEIP